MRDRELNKEGCGSCRFWLPDPKCTDQRGTGGWGFGYCRRRPPRLISPLAKVARGTLRCGHQQDMDELFGACATFDATAFPGTYYTEWCGEFEAAPEGADVVPIRQPAEVAA